MDTEMDPTYDSPSMALVLANRTSTTTIGRLPLAYVLGNWRPGSFDRDWDEEFTDRGSDRRIEEMWGDFTDHLIPSVLRGGWQVVEPVTLGWDGGVWRGRQWHGRVWAGHARLFLAARMGRETVLADVVPAGERRSGKHAHCAPTEGRLG